MTEFDGPNAAYATSLLYDYSENPEAVPEEWRELLAERVASELGSRSPQYCQHLYLNLSCPNPPPAVPDQDLAPAVAAAMSLVKAYRMHGHLAARLDPLGSEPIGDPALQPQRLEPPLTLEVQQRIPAALLRLHVPGETLATRCRGSRRRTAARSHTRSSTFPVTRSGCGCGG